MITLFISRKAATNGQRLFFAFFKRVVRTNAASRVLLPRLNPNWSSPRRWLSSTAAVISPHILTVTNRRRLEGIVTGRYWDGSREFPPCHKYKYLTRLITIQLKLNKLGFVWGNMFAVIYKPMKERVSLGWVGVVTKNNINWGTPPCIWACTSRCSKPLAQPPHLIFYSKTPTSTAWTSDWSSSRAH